MDKFTYGEYLRTIRKAKGLKQDEMADKLGISQTSYSRIECGIVLPQRERFNRIAAVLTRASWDSLPGLEKLDYDTMASTRGKGTGQMLSAHAANFFNTIIKFVFALLFANVAYDMARGACDGAGAAEETKIIASWIAAVMMIWMFYCWANRQGKRLGL